MKFCKWYDLKVALQLLIETASDKVRKLKPWPRKVGTLQALIKQTPLKTEEDLTGDQVDPVKQVNRQDILQTLSDWAKRWSAQDVEGYLTYHADEFAPTGSLSRTDWKSQRRQRLTKPSFISVEITKPRIVFLNDAHVRISFEQMYKSDTYRDEVIKQLQIKRIGGRWQIIEERVIGTQPVKKEGDLTLVPRLDSFLLDNMHQGFFSNPLCPSSGCP